MEKTLHTTNPELHIGNYRSVSLLAVVAFLLGLLSPISLANPILWMIPVGGLLCGILAFFRLKSKSDLLTGRPIAVIGTILSVFFGSCAVGTHVSNLWLLDRTSRAFATEWLQTVLDGELEKAHQAHLVFYQRQPEGTSLQEHYAHSPLDSPRLESFFDQPILQELKRFSPEATIEHLKTVNVVIHSEYCVVQHVYRVSEGDNSIRIRVRTERVVEHGYVFWSILRVLDEAEVEIYE